MRGQRARSSRLQAPNKHVSFSPLGACQEVSMYPCVFSQLTFGPTFLFVHGQQPYGVEMILVDYN
jgi:hypothetical protein